MALAGRSPWRSDDRHGVGRTMIATPAAGRRWIGRNCCGSEAKGLRDPHVSGDGAAAAAWAGHRPGSRRSGLADGRLSAANNVYDMGTARRGLKRRPPATPPSRFTPACTRTGPPTSKVQAVILRKRHRAIPAEARRPLWRARPRRGWLRVVAFPCRCKRRGARSAGRCPIRASDVRLNEPAGATASDSHLATPTAIDRTLSRAIDGTGRRLDAGALLCEGRHASRRANLTLASELPGVPQRDRPRKPSLNGEKTSPPRPQRHLSPRDPRPRRVKTCWASTTRPRRAVASEGVVAGRADVFLFWGTSEPFQRWPPCGCAGRPER